MRGSLKRFPNEQVLPPKSYLKRCKVADRLSELPDDILVCIISRLKLKEAVRTSILSQRWRSLWTFTTGALDFHYADPVSYGPYWFAFCMGLHYSKKVRPVESPEFIACVNHVLSLHQASTIDDFEVSAKLFGQIRKTTIRKWLEFAFQKRVKTLKLDFTQRFRVCQTKYSIKKQLLRKFSSHLDSLKILHLKKMDVSSKAVHYVLRKCCFLEELHLERSSCLVEIKVPGPMPQLRSLKIIDCYKLRFIQIHAINILVFAYHGHNIPLTFGKAPLLVDASLGGSYADCLIQNITQFPSYFSTVVSLELNLSGYHPGKEGLAKLPTFVNLRDLKLMPESFCVQSTLDCCASFLEKCPILRRFMLHVAPRPTNGTSLVKDRSKECFHSSLNVLELEGVVWFEEVAEIYCSIVSCLPSLEQVILRPFASIVYDKAQTKEMVADQSKHLKMVMPPRAELIVNKVKFL